MGEDGTLFLMVSHLDAKQRQQLRKQLLKKGAEINEKLTGLLAGEAVSVSHLLEPTKPGERPEERLRRFLELIDRKLHAIQEGSYGNCSACSAALPFVELEQMPWADLCRACSDQGKGAVPGA